MFHYDFVCLFSAIYFIVAKGPVYIASTEMNDRVPLKSEYGCLPVWRCILEKITLINFSSNVSLTISQYDSQIKKFFKNYFISRIME